MDRRSLLRAGAALGVATLAGRSRVSGALDENRLLFSVGRDLVLPGMTGEPLNFFVYPYVEVDGEPFTDVEAGDPLASDPEPDAPAGTED